MIKQAKVSYFLGKRFDSEFELTVYKRLLQIYSASEIEVHDDRRSDSKTLLLIKPASKHFQETYWNCDFYIPCHHIYVEAKGSISNAIFETFVTTLKQLDVVNPDVLERLIIVTGDTQASSRKSNVRRIAKGIKTTPFNELGKAINDLKATYLVNQT